MAKSKLAALKELNQKVNDGIRHKIRKASSDPREIALVLIELLLTISIVLSLIFILDPQLSFPEAVKIPDILKFFLIAAAMFIVYRIYGYTNDFRVAGN